VQLALNRRQGDVHDAEVESEDELGGAEEREQRIAGRRLSYI
jgi:hypothetical protein